MKKLLSILSVFSLSISLSNIVISCKNINTKVLTLNQQENDIINAINNKNTKSLIDDVKISDIQNWKNISYKNIDKNNLSFYFDITLNQNSKTFLNNQMIQNKYRIIDIKGQFNLDNNKINNDNYKLNYLVNKFNIITSSEGSLLGTSNNCVLYISDQDFDTILHSLNPIEDMKKLDIYNDYVSLSNDDWKNILNEIYINLNKKYFRPSKDYGVLLIIQNGNLEYTNLIKNHSYDLPLNKDGRLNSSFINSNSSLDNYYINKNILLELNDIYNSYKNNELYGKNNWNIANINNLFISSGFNLNYKGMNLEPSSFAKSVLNLFINHYNDVVINLLNYYINKNPKLNHQDKGILLSFDKNNDFISDIYQNDNFI